VVWVFFVAFVLVLWFFVYLFLKTKRTVLIEDCLKGGHKLQLLWNWLIFKCGSVPIIKRMAINPSGS